MTAISIYMNPEFSRWFLGFFLLVTVQVGLIGLLAWMASKVSRRLAYAVVAIGIAMACGAVVRAEDIIIIDVCHNFEPWSFEWIMLGCWGMP